MARPAWAHGCVFGDWGLASSLREAAHKAAVAPAVAAQAHWDVGARQATLSNIDTLGKNFILHVSTIRMSHQKMHRDDI